MPEHENPLEDAPATPDSMMSTAEAAERLGLGIATLYKHIGAGKLKPTVKGQTVQLEREAVEAFFEELAQDKGSFAGSLETLHGKVLDALRSLPNVELEEEPEQTADAVANDLLRLAASQPWQSLTLTPNGDRMTILYEVDQATTEFAALESALARELAKGLCALAGLDTEKAAARAQFHFEADTRKTEFRAARAKASGGEHIHFVRLEEDHPDFAKIWSLDSAQAETVDQALTKASGLYLLVSPRDLAGEAHLLALAKRLCPEQTTGILLTRGSADHDGFLTPLHYGDGEDDAPLDDAIKTVFALGARLCVFSELQDVGELRAALEIAAAGIPVAVFAAGASLPETLATWRKWEASPEALNRALTLAVERQTGNGQATYRLLEPGDSLTKALAEDNIAQAVSALLS